MALKVLRIVVKDICRLWDGHIDYPFFLADLPKGLDLYYNPAFDSQKRKKVVQSPSIKALSHFFALLRIIVFFSYLLFDV